MWANLAMENLMLKVERFLTSTVTSHTIKAQRVSRKSPPVQPVLESLAQAVAKSASELEEHFPTHVVCQWIGNSQQVARKHDLQVTAGHDERATSNVATFVASKLPQRAANQKCDAAKRRSANGRHGIRTIS